MQYKVVSYLMKNIIDDRSVLDASRKIEGLVNDAIKDGWKPQGGVAISHADKIGMISIAQAMIKE